MPPAAGNLVGHSERYIVHEIQSANALVRREVVVGVLAG